MKPLFTSAQGPTGKHELNIFRRKSSGKTLDDIRDDLLSARSYIKSQMDGVYLMDGVIKRTTTEYVEEGGQIVEVKSKIIFWLCFMSIRGIRTLDFSRKTTNAVISGLQIVDVIK